MITSTGNNFGAGSITLKDFQSEKVLVLNGKFSFSNKSEAFKAATVLEIYVPTLSIPKSGMSGCYVMLEANGKFYGTTIKTWIKNRNTICVEKLDHWSDQTDEYTIYFANLYVPKGQRGVFEVCQATRLTLTNTTSNNNYGYYQSCYICDDWCMIALMTGSYNTASGSNDEVVKLDGFPTDVHVELPFVGDSINGGQSYGTDMLKATIKEATLTVHQVPFGWGGMPKEHFLFGVFIRNKSAE